MKTGPQHVVAADLLQRNERVTAAFESALGGLDATQLAWRPPGGGWSVAQVLEHLCVATDSYLVVLLQKRGGSQPVATDTTRWRPSFLGGLLANSMRSPRKLPTPRIHRPGPEPRPNVAGEFLTRQREIGRLIQSSAGIDWRKLRMASPVSRFIRMNLGDCFEVLVAHAERHLGQVTRIKAEPAYPAPL